MSASPSRNEQIKEASRFLRGSIADGLAKVEPARSPRTTRS